MINFKFVADAAERSVRTFAQSLLGFMTISGLIPGMTWWDALAGAGMATLYSVLTSVAGGLPTTGTPSVLPRNLLPNYKPIKRLEGQR